jgi:hypothetical protein
MLIPTEQYNIISAACGLSITFDELRPKPIKIADITSSQRVEGISSLSITNLSDEYPITTGTRVVIAPNTASFLSPDTILNNSYIGNFTLLTASADEITYFQSQPDADSADALGQVFLENNIEPKSNYSLEFKVESVVPSGTTVDIVPEIYTISGNDKFTPITSIQIIPKFSTSAKVLLKMTVKSFDSNNIIKTQYKEIIVSDSSNIPCEIVSDNPIENEFVILNKDNDWSYVHQNYILAKFIPYNNNINSIILNKKNNQLLPNRGDKNRFRIIADPLAMKTKSVTVDQIRSAILATYNDIESTKYIANLGNKSYDIVIDDIFISADSFKDLVVAIVPPVSGEPVKFSEVAEAKEYLPDLSDIPSIGLVRYNGINIGQLQYNYRIYDGDTIKADYLGTEISGKITPIYVNSIELV